MDVHKDSIEIAIADEREARHYARVGGEAGALDRAVREIRSVHCPSGNAARPRLENPRRRGASQQAKRDKGGRGVKSPLDRAEQPRAAYRVRGGNGVTA
jgi:hypothetical protein